MQKELFSKSDVDSGLNLIVISYFDRMYEDGSFIKAIELLSKKSTLSTDGAYCHFPDQNSYDESEHFEGVEFAIGYPPPEDDIIIVSEKECYQYVRLACRRYLDLKPEDANKINVLLEKMLEY